MVPLTARVFVVVGAVATLTALSCPSSLRVKDISPLSYRDLIDRAPIVVMGIVTDVKTVGPMRRTQDNNRYPLRLQRIAVQPENVLRGSSLGDDFAFYRYGWSPDEPMVGPWGVVTPGQRGVFFLEREEHLTRALVDLYPSHIEIRSGRHPGYRSRAGVTLEHCISEILLTPGVDVDLEAFGNALAVASTFSIELIGETFTMQLMKPLLHSDSPELRRKACFALNQRFPGQVQCPP